MRQPHVPILLLLAAAMTMLHARVADAQISALVSPGRLAKAHASLEGIGSCLSCHAAGQRVAADRCLTCHQPVARRIAQKKGVHRNVTTDCTSCHVEHAGVDAELRPFDQRKFDHAIDAGFPLDGQHAALASNCAACHKTRSFLAVSASCASCHNDVHKGALGTRCETCHGTAIKFSETRAKFDHARTPFPLTGAHTRATCESCHRKSVFKGIASTCSSCHTDPHRGQFKGTCSSCHVTDSWRTAKVDHVRTAFPLRGAHAAVACVQCHTRPAMQVKAASATCATCHADPHKGNFQQDCRACHNESSFRKGTFDHAATRFALVDGHAGLTCAACHDARSRLTPATTTNARPRPAAPTTGARPQPGGTIAVDFRGLKTDCASCHADVHQGEFANRCETCHTPKTFHVTSFTHARPRAFFGGQHGALTCVACHPPTGTRPQQRAASGAVMARVGLSRTSDSCASCHRDVHDGQLGTACESCHTVDTPHFAVPSFRHDLTKFPLTGKHATAQCQQCHVAPATGARATGAARQFRGVGTACATCHPDPHRGELAATCETCHSTETFTITKYQHRNARALRSFFTGRHLVGCEACHPPNRNVTALVTRAGSSPRPLQSFKARTDCVSCHADIHRGALGPRCDTCHKP